MIVRRGQWEFRSHVNKAYRDDLVFRVRFPPHSPYHQGDDGEDLGSQDSFVFLRHGLATFEDQMWLPLRRK
jgi:hypothetical protein